MNLTFTFLSYFQCCSLLKIFIPMWEVKTIFPYESSKLISTFAQSHFLNLLLQNKLLLIVIRKALETVVYLLCKRNIQNLFSSLCLICCLCKHKSKYHIIIIKFNSITNYILKNILYPIEKEDCVRVKNYSIDS
jgi:hypothetical protein